MFWPAKQDENDVQMFGYKILANVHRASLALGPSRNFYSVTAT
jgi:hypothetical protein